MAQLSQAQQASDAIERPTIDQEVSAAAPGGAGAWPAASDGQFGPSDSIMTHRFDA